MPAKRDFFGVTPIPPTPNEPEKRLEAISASAERNGNLASNRVSL
jgi:hypothetical protein